MSRQFENSERLPATKIPKKLFVLAFEGSNTEVQYFNALKDISFFEDKLIEIHCVEREKKGDSAPSLVLQHLQKAASTLSADPKKDEIWMIVDQDRNQIKENKQNLNTIKKECTQKGFKLAVTVPLIEFWLYLHLVDVQKLSPEEKIAIYDNKKISTKSDIRHLERLLSKELQKRPDKRGYKKANIYPSRFLPTYRDAVERARAFDQGEESYPRKLGSDLYKLFDALSEST